MSSIDDVLRETISKLSLDTNLKTEDFTYLIGEFARIIDYRKNQEFYYNNESVNEVSGGSIINIFSEKTIEADKESPIIEHGSKKTVETEKESTIIESPTTVTLKRSFKEILTQDGSQSNVDTSSSIVSSNSVTSTNSSRNSGQQYSIEGISYENPKNQKVDNIHEFINSMLDQGILMWRIIYYIYISNKEFDNSASTSAQDAENNVKALEILAAYSSNQLLNFNEIHEFFPYMKYYFEKIIKYEDGKYVKNITGNIFLKTRFLSQINSRIKK